jgi:peptide/nickel transport system ATP-binding protein
VLTVENLSIHFPSRRGEVQALDRVNLAIEPGEIVGLVGESGSGKSVLSYAISGLLDPAARVVGGRILWYGAPIAPIRERRSTRAAVAQIFQNPRASLNPIRTVGRQLQDLAGKAEVRPLLESVRLAAGIGPRYPFELSGGQCQRIGIALALACKPDLLIVDVTTEAAVMSLIAELACMQRRATLLVTHNLPLAATHCHRIAVMHAGQIVETAPVARLIAGAQHPYSAELLAATPQHAARAEDLHVIQGRLPDLSAPMPPCRFAMRCKRHEGDCDAAAPLLASAGHDHLVACKHPLC